MLLCCLCARDDSILGHYFTLLFNFLFFWSRLPIVGSSSLPSSGGEKGCSSLQSRMHIQHFEIFIRVHFKQRMRSLVLFLQRRLRPLFYLYLCVEKEKYVQRLDQGAIADSASNLHILYTEMEVKAEGSSCVSIQKGKKRESTTAMFSLPTAPFPSSYRLCYDRWLRAKQATLTKHSENNNAAESG